ncbi:type II toxin-antitoxin system RelB/DinJ family antitoxin [uncultured Turicimonas sp.]|jgi:antitoxin component of RelBE/YafQ-DinJ toxin-antitoxin module|uniref:type II toxin-antitoxin system RelB/DinJ family antitoxin n=1 Tax=uncultured Turicimonas sp. TaxID=1918607 RepID=UPI0028050920|nr:type II toxin-antitoxin system RelB/DinJ family antitoxin [uncultured Turicimonas sp.]
MADVLISFEVSKETLDSAKSVLKTNGMTVEELCQQVLTYIAETEEIPFQKIRASEEDDELVSVASKRLQETGAIRVKLEDL